MPAYLTEEQIKYKLSVERKALRHERLREVRAAERIQAAATRERFKRGFEELWRRVAESRIKEVERLLVSVSARVLEVVRQAEVDTASMEHVCAELDTKRFLIPQL